MRFAVLILLTILLSNCNSSEKIQVPKLDLKNISLKTSVEKFIKTLCNKHKFDKIITLNISRSGDTTTIDLINSLPDTAFAKINAVAKYKDFIVYLVGDYPLDSFFIINNNDSDSVYEIPKKYESQGPTDQLSIEYQFWKLYFINDRIIKTFPNVNMLLNDTIFYVADKQNNNDNIQLLGGRQIILGDSMSTFHARKIGNGRLVDTTNFERTGPLLFERDVDTIYIDLFFMMSRTNRLVPKMTVLKQDSIVLSVDFKGAIDS